MKNNIVVKLSWVICLAALLAIIPILSACAPEEVMPPPEKVIKIGVTPDLTGPYSPPVSEIHKYVTFYWRYLNEEKGGINGIPVELMWADVRSDPSIIISTYRRFKLEGIVALHSYTSVDATCLISFANRDKIPLVGHGSATTLLSPPAYNYACSVNGAQAMIAGAEWYLNEWKKKGLDRPMRLAILGWDNPYGREGLEPLALWAPEHGVDLVAALWVSPLALDYTTELLVIKDKKVDVIASIGHGGAASRDAVRIGLPEDVRLYFCLGSIETRTHVALAGDAIKNSLAIIPYYTTSEGKPMFKLLKELSQRYIGETPHEVTADCCAGWNQAAILHEGIKNALAEVGYENLTGEAVARGLERIQDLDTGIGYPVSYADYPGDRIASEAYKTWRFDLAADWWVPISDWYKAMSFPELVRKYT